MGRPVARLALPFARLVRTRGTSYGPSGLPPVSVGRAREVSARKPLGVTPAFLRMDTRMLYYQANSGDSRKRERRQSKTRLQPQKSRLTTRGAHQ
ncbi:hypothetical protein MRX96_058639 [Rhipicephalus microplus]